MYRANNAKLINTAACPVTSTVNFSNKVGLQQDNDSKCKDNISAECCFYHALFVPEDWSDLEMSKAI